jgi:hypothetical protein
MKILSVKREMHLQESLVGFTKQLFARYILM